MRNLKRALSLALASVMLLGMMVVGTSAASANSFTDADEIVNKEAVAIATGLGIFDGYTDGSFGPDKVVTRAEAAVVISKILYGSDVNPKNFAGAGKFTDVPAWAEGYVNLCNGLGIVVGVSENEFAPNATVTTAQFTTMLLKALGYYVSEGDALGVDWDMVATSKAVALGLYGDLELKMDEGLTRENVAELAFNALFAQRVAFDDVRGLHVKASDRSVVVTNGTVDAMNTLAQNTYGLYCVEGLVVANSATDKTLSAAQNTKALTKVEFEEKIDLDQNGVAEVTEYDFEYETGLDMIGHSVKVYYTLSKKAPVVYAITDNATLVATVDSAIRSAADLNTAARKAGFKNQTISATEIFDNYDLDGANRATTALSNASAGANDRVIFISNSGDKSVDYVIYVHETLDYVDSIRAIKKDGETTYKMNLDQTGSKLVGEEISYAGEVNEGDYVIVTAIGTNFHHIYAADVKTANVTEINTSNSTTAVKTLVADGVTYSASPVVVTATGALAGVYAFASGVITELGEHTLILDAAGKVVGVADIDAEVNYAYVGMLYKTTGTSVLGNTTDTYEALVFWADGTVGSYPVAKSGALASDAAVLATAQTARNTAWAQLGIYNVNENSNGSVTIKAVTDRADNQTGLNLNTVTKNMSLLRPANGGYYANNETVMFYVSGLYNPTETNLGYTVTPVIGYENFMTQKAATVTGVMGQRPIDMTSAAVGQNTFGYYKLDNKGMPYMTAGVAKGPYDGVTPDVVFYMGNYVTKDTNNDQVIDTITYTVYRDGVAETLSYDYTKTAVQAAVHRTVGYMTIGANGLNAYTTNVYTGNTLNGADANRDDLYDIAAGAYWYNNTLTVGGLGQNVIVDAETAVYDLTEKGIVDVDDLFDGASYKTITIFVKYNATTLKASEIYVSYALTAGTNSGLETGSGTSTTYTASLTKSGTDLVLKIAGANGAAYAGVVDYVVTMTNTTSGFTYQAAAVDNASFTFGMPVVTNSNNNIVYSIKVVLADGTTVVAGPVAG